MLLSERLKPIGTITVPVYAHNLRGATNLAGFAFMKFADHIADVTVETDGKERSIGSIGGVIGGHYEVHIDRDQHPNGESEANLLLSREDVWNAVLALFDSPEAQAVVASLTADACERDRKRRDEFAAESEAEELRIVKQQIEQIKQWEGKLRDELRGP